MEQQPEYVGIDLHRRLTVIVRMAGDGTVLDTVRIDNDAIQLATELAKAGHEPEVAMEATLGWYWAADVITCPGPSSPQTWASSARRRYPFRGLSAFTASP